MSKLHIKKRLEVIGHTGKPHICRHAGLWVVFRYEHYSRLQPGLHPSALQASWDDMARTWARTKNQQGAPTA